MKSIFLFFLCIASTVFGGIFQCDDHYVSLGGNYTRARFTPTDECNYWGNMGGAQGLYEYKPVEGSYFALGLYWKAGTLSGSYGKNITNDYNAVERLGYTLDLGCNNLTLFSGFGFRTISHNVSYSNTLLPFLSTQYNYYELYIPVGIIFRGDLSSNLTYSIRFQWSPQVFTSVRIAPQGGAYWSISRQLGNYLVEIPFTYAFDRCKRYNLVVSPYYERWNDGSSSAVTSGGTPLNLVSNTYDFYGVNIDFRYAF